MSTRTPGVSCIAQVKKRVASPIRTARPRIFFLLTGKGGGGLRDQRNVKHKKWGIEQHSFLKGPDRLDVGPPATTRYIYFKREE